MHTLTKTNAKYPEKRRQNVSDRTYITTKNVVTLENQYDVFFPSPPVSLHSCPTHSRLAPKSVRQTKRRPTTSSANAAPCIACETDPYRTKPGSTTASQRKLASTVSTAKAAAAAAAAVATRRATQSSSGVVRNNRRKAPAGSVGAGGGLARRGAVEGLGVPFIGSGTGLESYNVVSAVSKAVRSARRGRPREVSVDRCVWGGGL